MESGFNVVLELFKVNYSVSVGVNSLDNLGPLLVTHVGREDEFEFIYIDCSILVFIKEFKCSFQVFFCQCLLLVAYGCQELLKIEHAVTIEVTAGKNAFPVEVNPAL